MRTSSRIFSAPHHGSQMALFMGTVFLWMGIGLAACAFVAFEVGSDPAWMAALAEPDVSIPLLFLPFVVTASLGWRIHRMSPVVAGVWYLILTSTLGVWLSGVVAQATTDPVLAQAVWTSLAVSSGMFGSLALFGFVTRRNLRPLGLFCFSCLLGLICAGLANLYFQSETFNFLYSLVGVVVFSGLIAFDVQNAKRHAHRGFGGALLASLNLFLDFINLFLYFTSLVRGDND